MERYSDRIVVVSQWLYDALRLNGVARDKLVLCRQGIDGAPPRVRAPRAAGAVLRVGFLGRYDPAKGIHMLVRAMHKVPASLPVQLRIHGIANGAAEADYARRIRAAAAKDPRILLLPPVAREGLWDAARAVRRSGRAVAGFRDRPARGAGGDGGGNAGAGIEPGGALRNW